MSYLIHIFYAAASPPPPVSARLSSRHACCLTSCSHSSPSRLLLADSCWRPHPVLFSLGRGRYKEPPSPISSSSSSSALLRPSALHNKWKALLWPPSSQILQANALLHHCVCVCLHSDTENQQTNQRTNFEDFSHWFVCFFRWSSGGRKQFSPSSSSSSRTTSVVSDGGWLGGAVELTLCFGGIDLRKKKKKLSKWIALFYISISPVPTGSASNLKLQNKRKNEFKRE